MSVLCTHVPDLLLTLTLQANPFVVGKPVAVLNDDDRITSLSQEAAAAGVTSVMSPARAQLTCPEIVFQDVNLPAFTQAQAAMLEILTQWELPTEEAGWGLAYVDLHTVTSTRSEVQQLAGELGVKVRNALGTSLSPSLGWDSGKFTAKAAAVRTEPGRMKLVDAADEVPFLSPLPITLLPLSVKNLRWLNRLGIRSLGQFGALPENEVQRALGKYGRLAQQWAVGHDARPVVDTVARRFDPIEIEMPYPTHLLSEVVMFVMQAIDSHLREISRMCQGVRQLELVADFMGESRCLNITFVDPTSQRERIESSVRNQFQSLSWPGKIQHITISNVQQAELPAPEQLGLFDEAEETGNDPEVWLAGIGQRFGAIRYQSKMTDPTHPVAENRGGLTRAA